MIHINIKSDLLMELKLNFNSDQIREKVGEKLERIREKLAHRNLDEILIARRNLGEIGRPNLGSKSTEVEHSAR
jgi:hypothetical protein